MTKTLADMTAEERDDCEGMWCEFVDFDDSDGYEHSTGSSRPKLGVIAGREGDGEHQVIHLKHGLFCIPDYDITPRPDLPRARTPDGEPVSMRKEYGQCEIGERPDGGFAIIVHVDGGSTEYAPDVTPHGEVYRWVGEWEQDNE